MGMISIALSSSVTPVSGARLLFGTAASNRAHVIFNGQSYVQTTFDITLECFHVLAALHILLYTIQVLDQRIRCSMF